MFAYKSTSGSAPLYSVLQTYVPNRPNIALLCHPKEEQNHFHVFF